MRTLVGQTFPVCLFLTVGGCGVDSSAAKQEGEPWQASFALDAVTGSESYLCFGFPFTSAARSIREIAWSAPEAGGIALHHTKLYALSTPAPAGPWPCSRVPEGAVDLAVWAPGAAPLTMPDGVGLVLPVDTASLIVEAHAVRLNDEAARPGRLRVALWAAAPAAQAAWMRVLAPVPILAPGERVTSTGACHAQSGTAVLFAWPHMHLRGREIHSRVVRGDGTMIPLADVAPWDFHEQRVYPLDRIPVDPTDVIEVSCTWQNDGPGYVFAGPRTVDEMCGNGLIVAPPAASRCAP